MMSKPEVCPVCGSMFLEQHKIKLDADSGILRDEDKIVYLTPTESTMMEALFECYPRVLSRDFFLERLYPHEADEPNIKIIDVFICKMRKTIKELDLEVVTHWGRGYSVRFL